MNYSRDRLVCRLVCAIENETVNLLMTSEISVPRGSWIRFNLASGGCWYGHGFSHRQPYPLNAEAIVNTRFAVNNIQSPIWMCSEGYAFLIDTTESLEVRCNEQGDGWLRIMCSETAVTVRVFQGKSLPEAHGQLMKHLHWPPPCPEARMFGDSIFCTWTQHPRAVLQGRVLEMAKAIRQHGFPCSMLTIDDRWESVFGELTFSDDFPDPAGMVRELHEMGFSVLLWTTPFVNQEAASYRELAERGWLAPRYDGSGPALLKWWGGTAGIVDITNPEAKEWYRTRLLRLMDEIGVDGFKIDGGDAKYMPEPSITAWHRNVGPSGYVDLYLSLYEEVAPGKCESRTAWLSQGRNILWREGGKDSHWGVDNGLKAMVNLGLHLALLGYDTLIPDMIPGRVQTMDANTPLPSDELFVRWVEASALMPLMQFSYYPWNYAETTSSIARQYALLHKSLEDYLVEQAFNRSAPLLRPLWYDNPDEADFYSIDDEFLLGNDLLVAPVLEEYQVARDIFLPSGNWRDAWTGELIQEKHLLQYPAPCPGIPIFVRAERKDLLQKIRTALDGIKKGGILSSTKSATYSSGLNRDISVTG